jgi:membrane associated rhomboid family serine protease
MWRSGRAMEEAYGSWRIMLVYFISGIGGFIFGGNLTDNMPSVGASGAIYGIMAVVLLDLILNFKLVPNRWAELSRMVVMITLSLAFGLLPLIDNFAHVGGFLVGILCGLFVLPAINFGKWDARLKIFVRLASGPMLFGVFIWMFIAFYSTDSGSTCTWCKYLDCIPIDGWCDGY